MANPRRYSTSPPIRSNAITPFESAGDEVAVRVVLNGSATPDFNVPVVANAPEIFRTTGNRAVALNQDGQVNSPGTLAARGSIVTIWATGILTFPGPADGEIQMAALDTHCCTVSVAYTPTEVLYAGPAPGLVAGIEQINFRVPVSSEDRLFL